MTPGAGATTGAAVLVLLAAMAGSWIFRSLLLGMLRTRHPEEFAQLGHPSRRQLDSLSPRHGDLQVRFWTYLWGGKVFRIGDRRVAVVALAALISDIALVGSVAALFWSAGH